MRPLTITLALALTASSASAQRGELPLDSTLLAALVSVRARIDRADSLRISATAGSTVLHAPRFVPSGLSYRSYRGLSPRIDDPTFQLQVPGRATWTGANIGAVVLGVTGAVLGVVGAGFACFGAERGCDPQYFEGGLLLGVVGAATGGLVGALVGSFVPTWRTIYRHQVTVAFP